MNCSPPGSSVSGISQARVLERAAIPSPRGPSRPRDGTRGTSTAGGLSHEGSLSPFHFILPGFKSQYSEALKFKGKAQAEFMTAFDI